MYCQLDRSKPCPLPLRPDQTYLGEDERGYYVMDGFFDNLGNMFKRMVKFTPKSFTPSNIFKGVRNTMLTTMTSGVYLALPKSVKKTMENVANVAIPVVAGGALAAAAGPAVMGILGPKLNMVAGALGKNITSVGGAIFDVLGKLPSSKQAAVAQQVTPQDIMYAEQHQGQFPPQFMQYVDEAAKQSYGYALNQPVQATPSQSLYADASLYPGLQASQLQALPQQEPAQEGISSESVFMLVGAGALVAYLVGRK